MQFFREKPLCLIIFVMLGGFSLFSLQNPILSLLLAILFSLLLITNCIVKKVKKDNYIFHIVLLSLFLLSTLLSHLYFDISHTVKAKESVIEAEITSKSDTEYGVRYEIRCIQIDGKNKNSKLILFADKEFNGFDIGDIILTKADIRSLNTTDDMDSYNYSQGFVGEAEHISDAITLVGHKERVLVKFLHTVRESFHNYIYKIFGKDSGGLLLALLIGDKSLLSGVCRLNFSRIGVSHILALSGQHLAILSLMLHRLLSLCQINKKWRLSILSIFVLAYMAITGFSPSVTRAGLMLLFSTLAFLFGTSYDLTTGLFTSVFLFVLIQPYSITDVSLLLSAFATFGVIHALVVMEDGKIKIPKFLYPIFSSVIISLFAMLYTSFFMVAKFSYTSIFSPITTLLFSLLVEVYIYIGLALSILGVFLPVSTIMSFLYKCIELPANFFSSLKFGYFSTNFTMCIIFAILLICALLYYLLYKIKHKRIAFGIICSLALLIYLSAFIGTMASINKDDLVYMQEDMYFEESFFLKEGGSNVYIDIAPTKRVTYKKTINNLKNEHLPYINEYVLMGYNSVTPEYLESLFKNIKVYSICLPFPETKNQEEIFLQIQELANTYYIKITTFRSHQYLSFSNSKLYITQIHSASDEIIPVFTIEYKSNKHLYISKGAIDEVSYAPIMQLMSECNGVIFGAKGIRNSDFTNINDLPSKIKRIILSNNLNYLDQDFYNHFLTYGEIYTFPKRLSLS